MKTRMTIKNSPITTTNQKSSIQNNIKKLSKWKEILYISKKDYNQLIKLTQKIDRATKKEIKAYKGSSHWKNGIEALSFLNSIK